MGLKPIIALYLLVALVVVTIGFPDTEDGIQSTKSIVDSSSDEMVNTEGIQGQKKSKLSLDWS